MCYGISHMGLRQFVYKCAQRLNISYTKKWDAELKTGLDWFKHFKARHRTFPKAPERTEVRKGRKRGSTRVLTDTLEVNAIEKQHHVKLKKNSCIQKVLGNCDFEVKFFRRFGNSNKFFYPPEDDISDVERRSIIRKLRQPHMNLATLRTKANLKFDIDFSSYETKFGRIL
ncbi:hypothetical protein RN001_004154 [Aquatica leii]|uniref:Uncharacterized protein n=1 Tax=Aquatica leii TaxID=1421715 RepID=A0AAN7QPH0_9COLE|nr:hypothetical protein RN001_004154 [Aquatica leii]